MKIKIETISERKNARIFNIITIIALTDFKYVKKWWKNKIIDYSKRRFRWRIWWIWVNLWWWTLGSIKRRDYKGKKIRKIVKSKLRYKANLILKIIKRNRSQF